MRPRALFVGLATLDLLQRVDRPPGVNEKIVAQRSDLAAGGPATTAALTCQALGGQSVLLSAFGTGPIARLAAGELTGAGIHLVDAWASGSDLSISAITVQEGTGDRSVVSRNAQDIATTVPSRLAVMVRDTDVVLIDGHHPELAVAAARAAHDAGVPVVLDCGSVKPVYAELMPLAEAAVCSVVFTAGGHGGFEAVAAALMAEGVRVVAMTDGAEPVRWRSRADTGVVNVPAVPVRDTLGAGDALHGAVAFAMAAGVRDPQRYLQFGVDIAVLRVQHIGPRRWLDHIRRSGLGKELRA